MCSLLRVTENSLQNVSYQVTIFQTPFTWITFLNWKEEAWIKGFAILSHLVPVSYLLALSKLNGLFSVSLIATKLF